MFCSITIIRFKHRNYEVGPAMFSMSDSLVNIRKMANKATALLTQSGKVFLVGGVAARRRAFRSLTIETQGNKKLTRCLIDAVDQDTSTNLI